MNCYCGQIETYTNCCEKLHKNPKAAKTAEQLMRSRYSAFVLANGDYLMQTHHKTTRPLKEKKAIVKWAKSVNWIKLEILNTSQGKPNDKTGTVTFNAYFYENGKVDIIHENSAFIQQDQQWFYLGLNTAL